MIFGSGPAGLDIARAFSHAGIATLMIEPDPHAAERARFFLGKTEMPPPLMSDLSAAQNAGFVFEAQDQPANLRVPFLTKLSGHLPKHTPIALTSLADLTSLTYPDALKPRLLGFQLCAPAHLRQLVEIAALPAARPLAFDLARRIGKTPVNARFDRASIATRLQRRLNITADGLLLHGAIPFELDDAMVDFGFDIGFYAAQDLIGLDVAYADRKRLAPTRDPTHPYVPISDRMVEEGRLGQKVGVGWYRYPGGGGAVIDPLVEDLIREEARFEGISTREFTATQMQDQIVLALIHEAAQMLEDQTAATDIDMVSVEGLGFPARSGGVISWADSKGAANIHTALLELAAGDAHFEPGPVLRDCAKRGIRLADWQP